MDFDAANLKVDDDWSAAPESPAIVAGEVQVWHLILPVVATPAAWSILSEDERVAARRFHFEIDRNRYVACRAAARRILGAVADLPPGGVPLAYGEHGKPFISGGNHGDVRFNVSHSGDHALIAVAMGCDVGVDVERVRGDVDHVGLAGRFFTAGERAYIWAVAPARRPDAFYQCWTRKEAWAKADGAGLSRSLDLYDVSSSLGCATQAVQDSETGQRWIMMELLPAAETIGALVTGPMVERVRLWRLADS